VESLDFTGIEEDLTTEVTPEEGHFTYRRIIGHDTIRMVNESGM